MAVKAYAAHAAAGDGALGWKVNMDGTFFLFEEALRQGVEQIFFPSSLAAYGGELPEQWALDLGALLRLSVRTVFTPQLCQKGPFLCKKTWMITKG